MNAEHLLDAIGMVDDRFLIPEQTSHTSRFPRRLTALIAAVLAIVLSIGTAMAVSPQFRQLVFSILHIRTTEKPPAGNTEGSGAPQQDSRPGLQEIDIAQIDGVVEAFYFSSGGLVIPSEGGFYTCERTNAGTAPLSPAFWEITQMGVVEVPSHRVDLPFTHGGRTFRIIFDYAVLHGKLCLQLWPEGLDEDPYGNAWNVVAIGDRTDAVVLSVPVQKDKDYTSDYFLLDLQTLETAALMEDTPISDIWSYACWFTEDLRYAIISGRDNRDFYGYWLCDLQESTLTLLDTFADADVSHAYTDNPYFLDNETLLFYAWQAEDVFDLVRLHIPTRTSTVLQEDISRGAYRRLTDSRWPGLYGMLERGTGEYELIDLRTNRRLMMRGLTGEHLVASQSPDGQRIMLAFVNDQRYTSLGLLDPATGLLKLLNREVAGESEYFWGWLDTNTLALTAWDDKGGYYAYAYRFLE